MVDKNVSGGFLEEYLSPWCDRLEKLSGGFGVPSPRNFRQDAPVYEAIGCLQEFPSAESVKKADWLIDILSPFLPDPLPKEGYGALYLDEDFWQTKIGALIFNHLSRGLPGLFVRLSEAPSLIIKQYGHKKEAVITRANLYRRAMGRSFPCYISPPTPAGGGGGARKDPYIRINHFAFYRDLQNDAVGDSGVTATQPAFVDNFLSPWIRSFSILLAAFGKMEPPGYIDPECPIAAAARSVEESLNRSSASISRLRQSIKSADYLIDLLVPSLFLEGRPAGWGAAYLDKYFWKTVAGEKIFHLYKQTYREDFLSLTQAARRIEKESSSSRMSIYIAAQDLQIPVYPVMDRNTSFEGKRIMRYVRSDHLQIWMSRNTNMGPKPGRQKSTRGRRHVS